MASNTVGRPRNEDNTSTLKVAIGSEHAAILNELAEKTDTSKADIVRDLVKTISSKNFETALSQTSLDVLEQYSLDCWKTLHNPACIFEVDTLSDMMPAYVIIDGAKPAVFVKFPTFKIQAFSSGNKLVENEQDVKDIMDNVIGINKVSIYTTLINQLIVGDLANFTNERRYVVEIMCLDDGLEKNSILKEEIREALEMNGYSYNILPAYCIKGDYIQLRDDKKSFKVIGDN